MTKEELQYAAGSIERARQLIEAIDHLDEAFDIRCSFSCYAQFNARTESQAIPNKLLMDVIATGLVTLKKQYEAELAVITLTKPAEPPL